MMTIYVNPKYSEIEGFIKEMPFIFPKSGDVIHSGRNTVKKIKVNGLVINIKSFKIPILINRIIYKYFRKSKAERSFKYAHTLLKMGIKTPEPIGYIEKSKNGLFTESYYISVHEEVQGTMKDIYNLPTNKGEELIKSFTDYTAYLHKKGVFHKDYSPGNILYKKVEQNYHFFLVDLNRIKFKTLSLFDSCKSFSRIKLDQQRLRLIVTQYSKRRNYNIFLCDLFINYFNRTFWKRHLIRHPENA